jgi:hypothetical protein
MGLLAPFILRHFGLRTTGQIMYRLVPVLIGAPLITLFRLIGDLANLNLVGRGVQIAANPMIAGITQATAISMAARNRLSLLAVILAVIGRICQYMVWFGALPILAGIMYFFLKEVQYLGHYLEQIYNILPYYVQNYIVNVQGETVRILTSLVKTGKEPVETSLSLIFILKTITYFDGWSYIGSILTYLNGFDFVQNYLLNNFIINFISGLTIFGIGWDRISVLFIWTPLNWLRQNTRVIDFVSWLFVSKDFFIFEWGLKVYRWIRNLF